MDQKCAFGSHVLGHAVYCHNTEWPDAPMKCRRSTWSRTWLGEEKYPDEACRGYSPNPLHAAAPPRMTDRERLEFEERLQRESDARMVYLESAEGCAASHRFFRALVATFGRARTVVLGSQARPRP